MSKSNKDSRHHITHMIGSKTEKVEIYKDFDCPVKILLEATLYICEKEDLDHSDVGIISALLDNPGTPADAIILLDATIKDKKIPAWCKNKLTQHLNHPDAQNRIKGEINRYSQFKENFYKIGNNNSDIQILLLDSCFLTGNSMNSFINYSVVNDYDFFFKNTNSALAFFNHVLSLSTLESIRNLSVEVRGDGVFIDSNKKIIFEWNKHKICITGNAITFTGGDLPRPFQFITRSCGTPEFITGMFDFAHCKSYYDIKEDKLFFPLKSVISVKRRVLLFEGGINPLNSLLRIKKFERTGWRINSKELLKLGFALSQYDLSNPEVLKASLLGFYGEDFGEFWEEEMGSKQNITFDDLCDYVEAVDRKQQEKRRKDKKQNNNNFPQF